MIELYKMHKKYNDILNKYKKCTNKWGEEVIIIDNDERKILFFCSMIRI